MSDTDMELLARYTGQHAEDAFTELVRRHIGLVYSAALRQVRSPQLAEEVAQSVFIDLARNAARLKPDTILTAWLYQVTHRTAIDVVRREASRQLREQIATEINAINATANDWRHIEPLLDEAMHALDDTDRTAVLLRYFENKSLREVGATLGTSENAAQKRLGRAVERLREFFARRGVTVGAGGLAVVISANAVQAAPAGLSAAIAAAALSGTTLVTSATATVGKAIAMTTVKKALITAGLAVAVGIGIYEARKVSTARREVESMKQQQASMAEQLEQATRARDQAARQIAALHDENERLNRNTVELLRLRGELGVLRQQKRELEQALALAGSRRPGPISNPAANPGGFQPFQLQLVMDEPAENTEVMTNSNGGAIHHVQKGPLLDHTSIRSANLSTNALGAPQIQIEFSPTGAEQFAQITKTNINKKLAVILGGKLYSAPIIRAEITGGKAQIDGSFTEEEARELTSKLNDAIGNR